MCSNNQLFDCWVLLEMVPIVTLEMKIEAKICAPDKAVLWEHLKRAHISISWNIEKFTKNTFVIFLCYGCWGIFIQQIRFSKKYILSVFSTTQHPAIWECETISSLEQLYHSPEWDSNLGLSRIAVFADCNHSATTTGLKLIC